MFSLARLENFSIGHLTIVYLCLQGRECIPGVPRWHATPDTSGRAADSSRRHPVWADGGPPADTWRDRRHVHEEADAVTAPACNYRCRWFKLYFKHVLFTEHKYKI